jgi:hypothetical protein
MNAAALGMSCGKSAAVLLVLLLRIKSIALVKRKEG